MKKLIISTLSLLCLLVPSHPVSAHVLITDDSNTKGAILHIIPDDDPVAGEEAVFYFETQIPLTGERDYVSLTAQDEVGNFYTVNMEIDGSMASASFNFPHQGVYNLVFTVGSNGNTYKFEHSQRVSRGIVSGASNTQKYAWAEMMLVGAGVAFALLVVVGFNNRKDIISHSKIG